MEPLLENVRFILADIKRRMEKALALTQEDDGPQLYEKVIRSDLEKYERLSACTDFFELYREITGITYDRLPSSRDFLGDEEKLARVKELRADAKELLKKLTKQYFFLRRRYWQSSFAKQRRWQGSWCALRWSLRKHLRKKKAKEPC